MSAENRKFADYEPTSDDRGEVQHSDSWVEECLLSDGSHTYNVVLRDDQSGLGVRFACLDEPKAWAFADNLAEIAWFEDLDAVSQ